MKKIISCIAVGIILYGIPGLSTFAEPAVPGGIFGPTPIYSPTVPSYVVKLVCGSEQALQSWNNSSAALHQCNLISIALDTSKQNNSMATIHCKITAECQWAGDGYTATFNTSIQYMNNGSTTTFINSNGIAVPIAGAYNFSSISNLCSSYGNLYSCN